VAALMPETNNGGPKAAVSSEYISAGVLTKSCESKADQLAWTRVRRKRMPGLIRCAFWDVPNQRVKAFLQTLRQNASIRYSENYLNQ
jgi:hypothetical protein